MHPTDAEIITVDPASGAVDVHPSRELRIRLGRNLALNPRDTSLAPKGAQGAKGAATPITAFHDPREKTWIVTPERPLERSTEYELCVSVTAIDGPIGEMRSGGAQSRHCVSFTTADLPQATSPSNAAILLVTNKDNAFGDYLGAILNAEGLNSFDVVSKERAWLARLDAYDVVVLSTSDVSAAESGELERWVRAGGALIAMRPGQALAALFGLSGAGPPPTEDPYLVVDRSFPAVKGVTGQSLQIHGPADSYELRPNLPIASDAWPQVSTAGDPPIVVARLYANRTRPLGLPAVTLRKVGQGHAVAFAFDLAKSVAYTRQGNPAWADQDRDGSPPRRSNDMFYPNHLDLELMGAPQADEHQRLFANLIIATARKPLPRYWYLPEGKRAALIMAGDDHATKGGSANLFADLARLSPPGCRLDHWECHRATALISPGTDFAPALAASRHAEGFEIGVHFDTGCKNDDNATLERTIARQEKDFRRKYPSLPQQVSNRFHCIVWNGWTDSAEVARKFGIRFDMNYYNWPAPFLGGRPGFMTGSGFPMPFVNEDGRVLDVYQGASELVNENGVPHSTGTAFVLDRALGEQQFFGAFVTHYDFSDDFAGVLTAAARERGVPLITAAQMLTWLDGRNRSTFSNIRWDARTLTFDQHVAPGAELAQVMLPYATTSGRLAAMRCGSRRLPFEVKKIKGLSYAFFAAVEGPCTAEYAA